MILTALLAAATLHGLPQPVLVPQHTTEVTAEGTEILRRVLVDALDAAFERKKEDQEAGDKLKAVRRGGFQVHSLVTPLWAGMETVQHARAFHLPDAGLFFALDASLPVVAKPKSAEGEKSDQPTDDEWERARREVRGYAFGDGTFRALRLASPAPGEIDPEAIEKVTDVVLRTLARHAARVEGLGARETITVALRLSGRSRTLLQDFGPHGEFRFDLDTTAEPLDESEGEGEGEDGSAEGFYAYTLATSQDVREQNLVIRIAVGDLVAFSEDGGTAGIGTLRKRALINRY